jgi:Protein of unknown function (DUF1549)/Planctomycete cytochrome C/Concanavalin A-like lectin/glucanases superfamily
MMVCRFPVASLVFLSLAGLVRAGDREAKVAFFHDQVRPILQRCVRCHGGGRTSAGLNLTTRARALQGGDSGPALVPGKADRSLLFDKVSSKKMPPKKPLTPQEISLVRKWIDDGASWEGKIEGTAVASEPRRAGPDWWSLQPVRRPSPPRVKAKQWARNPIDAFVLVALEARGLAPAPEADRQTLIRRATFDLTGLPPMPDEVVAFVKDQRPGPYERLVDRLLASPAYGERWGRHWLDVARFGESQGFERDKIRDHAWHYRDYVIRAFNADRPYPQFIREQIAGDVLEAATPQTVMATGFLVAGPWDEVGANQQGALMRARVREEELEDMISATAQTFLGMTVNCARCHDHKFDPILQRDYYRLKAALEGVRHGDRPTLTPAQSKERETLLRRARDKVGRLEHEIAAIEQIGRERVQRQSSKPDGKGLPVPVARWSFESDARDSIGSLHGTLQGGAALGGGRLKLNGKGAYVRTAPLGRELREKTLEAWVELANLGQRGGGVISIQTQDGRVFDAIVFGERQPGKWIAGSDFFHRTRDVPGPVETARRSELIHMAVTYASDNRITVYRNGALVGSYTPTGADATLRTLCGR